MSTVEEIEARLDELHRLNEEVERKIFGTTNVCPLDGWDHFCFGKHPESYSTDIAAAWLVVEKMRDQDFDWLIENANPGVWVRFEPMSHSFGCGELRANGSCRHQFMATETTAPLAICRAALNAFAKVPA